MLQKLLGTLPPYFTIIGAALSVVVPWTIYKTVRVMYKYADPPWKKEDSS